MNKVAKEFKVGRTKENVFTYFGLNIKTTAPPLPSRWVHAQDLTPWKLKRPFFICYQGSHHEIGPLDLGLEIIEF